jgi:hypothetical protein
MFLDYFSVLYQNYFKKIKKIILMYYTIPPTKKTPYKPSAV